VSRSSMCSNEMALEAVELLSNASHTDLAFEWSMLCQDCAECWTTTGKTPVRSKCYMLNTDTSRSDRKKIDHQSPTQNKISS
jgi:hypothetical protein